MQMLIMRRADHALLAEPAISIALRKTKSFPISIVAPDLYRSTDLQEEWARVFKTNARIPVAGMAVVGKMMENATVIDRFLEEYRKSLQWYRSHPKEAGRLIVQTLPMLQEEGVSDSIAHVNLDSIDALKAKKELEFFQQDLI